MNNPHCITCGGNHDGDFCRITAAWPVEPRLLDRSDGVQGHFCIGRSLDGMYYEFWHEKTGWSSAGTVIVGREAAEAKLRELTSVDPISNVEAAKEKLISAASHYVELHRKGLTPYIRENGRDGNTSAWAELLFAAEELQRARG